VGRVTTVHVLTLPLNLPMTVLDRVLLGVETALAELGATAVWIDPDRPALAVMAELPTTSGTHPALADPGASG
jgi:hypothetical protein